MEKWVFKIKYKEISRAEKLRKLIQELTYSGLSNDKEVGNSIQELIQILENEHSSIESQKEIDKLEKFLYTDSLLKYWKVCIDGEEKYCIFPFESRKWASIGFLIQGLDKDSSDYKSIETKYYAISAALRLFGGDETEFIEISEEEFREKVQKLSLQPLDSRLWKLTYRDHKLTPKTENNESDQ